MDTGLNPSGSWAVTRSDLMRVSQTGNKHSLATVHSGNLRVKGGPSNGHNGWNVIGRSELYLMRVSHSFFWPAVRTLPSLTCPPCKYEGMDMPSSWTLVCKIWGQFRWNLVLYGHNILFWTGSINRPYLQTANGYRAESIRVDSNMLGQYTWAVTRSDLMRVSHSWTLCTIEYSWNFKTFLTCIVAV